jgi:hypothetical protein
MTITREEIEAFASSQDDELLNLICTLAMRTLDMQPRPIADAPTDGSHLLCWHEDFLFEIFSAAWCKRKKTFCDLPDEDRFEGGFEGRATHFIPLSALPKVTAP